MVILNRYIGAMVIALVIIFLSFAAPSFAEKVTFVKEYTYQASDFDSRHSSRTIALEMVKRLLLEELGTYLISETEVKNMQLTKDQVTTYSAGIVSAEVIEEKWDGKTFWLKAKVSADPKEAAKALKKIMDDQFKGKELAETRKKAEELVKENERLKRELEALAKAKKRDKKAEAKKVKEYEKTIKGLNAIEWFEKGNSYDRRAQNDKAIEAYTNAIALNPKFVEAYLERSGAYYTDSKFDKALQDIQEAIRINPKYLDAYIRIERFYNLMAYPFLLNGDNDKYVFYQNKIIEACNKLIKLQPKAAMAYLMRGRAYKEKGDFNKALSDFNKINSGQFHPNPLVAYQDRGDIYVEQGQYAKAIDDYTKAINALKNHRMPNTFVPPELVAYPFIRRGYVYLALRNYQEAIKDFTKVIELSPDYAEAYYARGRPYGKLGNYPQAIKDYTKAIELKPDHAEAYYRRGLAYSKLGNQQQTISDFKIAARLGDKEAQDALLKLGEQW